MTRLTCCLMSDLVISKHRKEFIHDTQCPCWGQVSRNNTKLLSTHATSHDVTTTTSPDEIIIAVLLTLKVLVQTIYVLALVRQIIAVQWEGVGHVGSARYELGLLPPCPTILKCSCQRSTHSISKWIFWNLASKINCSWNMYIFCVLYIPDLLCNVCNRVECAAQYISLFTPYHSNCFSSSQNMVQNG